MARGPRVVDLDVLRRARAELAKVVAEYPELTSPKSQARLAHHIATKGFTDMPLKPVVGIRLEPSLVEALDTAGALVPALSRHGLCRAALHIGLAAIAADPTLALGQPVGARQPTKVKAKRAKVRAPKVTRQEYFEAMHALPDPLTRKQWREMVIKADAMLRQMDEPDRQRAGRILDDTLMRTGVRLGYVEPPGQSAADDMIGDDPEPEGGWHHYDKNGKRIPSTALPKPKSEPSPDKPPPAKLKGKRAKGKVSK